MIVSSIDVGALFGLGFGIPQVFLATGLLNLPVAVYIFLLVPNYLLCFIAFMATRCIYRFKLRGDEHIPASGAAVPVALQNLWGSYFSRVEQGRAMVQPFRRGLLSRVGLVAGAAVLAAEVTPQVLRERVAGLLAT